MKFDIVADDGEVEGLIDVIVSCAQTGQVGDGKIFVFPVEEAIRIRTGERGTEAV